VGERVRSFRVLSRSKLGYRGSFLLTLAVLDLLYGWSLINPSPEQLRSSAYEFRSHLLPTEAFGMVWIVVGIVLAMQAWIQKDRVGFTLAIAIKMVWAFIAFASFATGKVDQGWVSCAIWLIFAAMTIVVSGWPEPIRSHTVTIMPLDDREDP
jgi:fatty acid desaturase